MRGARSSRAGGAVASQARALPDRSARLHPFIERAVRVTKHDERRWLIHVAGFRDPESPRAQRYAQAWDVREKIRRALLDAARRGLPRSSIFQRWEHASW